MCSVDYFTEYNSHGCTQRRLHNSWSNDGGWIEAAVLAAVSDDVDRDELQRGNIDDQEGAHLIGGKAFGLCLDASAAAAFLFEFAE